MPYHPFPSLPPPFAKLTPPVSTALRGRRPPAPASPNGRQPVPGGAAYRGEAGGVCGEEWSQLRGGHSPAKPAGRHVQVSFPASLACPELRDNYYVQITTFALWSLLADRSWQSTILNLHEGGGMCTGKACAAVTCKLPATTFDNCQHLRPPPPSIHGMSCHI